MLPHLDKQASDYLSSFLSTRQIVIYQVNINVMDPYVKQTEILQYIKLTQLFISIGPDSVRGIGGLNDGFIHFLCHITLVLHLKKVSQVKTY